mgnify:CR=1 FL=1
MCDKSATKIIEKCVRRNKKVRKTAQMRHLKLAQNLQYIK